MPLCRATCSSTSDTKLLAERPPNLHVQGVARGKAVGSEQREAASRLQESSLGQLTGELPWPQLKAFPRACGVTVHPPNVAQSGPSYDLDQAAAPHVRLAHDDDRLVLPPCGEQLEHAPTRADVFAGQEAQEHGRLLHLPLDPPLVSVAVFVEIDLARGNHRDKQRLDLTCLVSATVRRCLKAGGGGILSPYRVDEPNMFRVKLRGVGTQVCVETNWWASQKLSIYFPDDF